VIRSNDRGVAMPTVLFVGAVLTAIVSISVYAAITELQIGQRDRRATQALTLAENGVPRLLLELKGSGSLTWGDIRAAGCTKAPIAVARGVLDTGELFNAELSVYDPNAAATERIPATPWDLTNNGAAPCVDALGNPLPSVPSVSQPRYFAISAEGQKGGVPAGTAHSSRSILQVIKVTRLQLPMGVFADDVTINGSPVFDSLSLLTTGDVAGREKIGFKNTDKIYTKADFWPTLSAAQAAPTAAHALGGLYLRGTGTPEHPPSLTCDANNAAVGKGTAGQSQWDQSGRGDVITSPPICGVGPPPTSYFSAIDMKRIAPIKSISNQSYVALKRAAVENGIHCMITGTGTLSVASCTAAGAPYVIAANTIAAGSVPAPVTSHRNYVAYFEFDTPAAVLTNEITWAANAGVCDTDPAVSSSVTIVVRNGGVKLQNATVSGAVIAREGAVKDSGAVTFNGSILAKSFASYSQSAIYKMDDCWVGNMPVAFLNIDLGDWREVD
jgi:hypothetical protein